EAEAEGEERQGESQGGGQAATRKDARGSEGLAQQSARKVPKREERSEGEIENFEDDPSDSQAGAQGSGRRAEAAARAAGEGRQAGQGAGAGQVQGGRAGARHRQAARIARSAERSRNHPQERHYTRSARSGASRHRRYPSAG